MNEQAPWPFDPLTPLRYGVILADPPWLFALRSSKGEKKAAQAKYSCMSFGDLAALPVRDLAAKNCALVMWATAPMLDRSIELVKAWGFSFKTAGTWAKRSKSGEKWAFGTGYIYRGAAEFYVLGVIGRPEIGSRSIRNLIVAPVREHSRKPDEMHVNLEKLFPSVARAELFARESRPGWSSWGLERTKFDAEAAA